MSSNLVRHQPSKLVIAGSSPVVRSKDTVKCVLFLICLFVLCLSDNIGERKSRLKREKRAVCACFAGGGVIRVKLCAFSSRKQASKSLRERLHGSRDRGSRKNK